MGPEPRDADQNDLGDMAPAQGPHRVENADAARPSTKLFMSSAVTDAPASRAARTVGEPAPLIGYTGPLPWRGIVPVPCTIAVGRKHERFDRVRFRNSNTPESTRSSLPTWKRSRIDWPGRAADQAVIVWWDRPRN